MKKTTSLASAALFLLVGASAFAQSAYDALLERHRSMSRLSYQLQETDFVMPLVFRLGEVMLDNTVAPYAMGGFWYKAIRGPEGASLLDDYGFSTLDLENFGLPPAYDDPTDFPNMPDFDARVRNIGLGPLPLRLSFDISRQGSLFYGRRGSVMSFQDGGNQRYVATDSGFESLSLGGTLTILDRLRLGYSKETQDFEFAPVTTLSQYQRALTKEHYEKSVYSLDILNLELPAAMKKRLAGLGIKAPALPPISLFNRATIVGGKLTDYALLYQTPLGILPFVAIDKLSDRKDIFVSPFIDLSLWAADLWVKPVISSVEPRIRSVEVMLDYTPLFFFIFGNTFGGGTNQSLLDMIENWRDHIAVNPSRNYSRFNGEDSQSVLMVGSGFEYLVDSPFTVDPSGSLKDFWSWTVFSTRMVATTGSFPDGTAAFIMDLETSFKVNSPYLASVMLNERAGSASMKEYWSIEFKARFGSFIPDRRH